MDNDKNGQDDQECICHEDIRIMIRDGETETLVCPCCGRITDLEGNDC
jgi:hypothetical protein